ncbi:MAG: hypothetical protein HKN08_06335 [Gammaproteobacteria bacterium]|nr:hypothetical protein [Gammaproteobacteria bacterium]
MTKKTDNLSPMTRIRHMLEFLIIRIFYVLFSGLPYQTASNLGGIIARSLFIHTRRTNIAKNNICQALPDMSASEVDQTIQSMWENVGRNFAELPHISSMQDREIMDIASITGLDNIHKDDQTGHGALYFTAHLGNWEIAPRLFSALGQPVSIV